MPASRGNGASGWCVGCLGRLAGVRRTACSHYLHAGSVPTTALQDKLDKGSRRLFLPAFSDHPARHRRASGHALCSPIVPGSIYLITHSHPLAQSIFVDKRGIDVLLDMLMDPAVSHRSHKEAAAALLQLTKKLDAHLPGGWERRGGRRHVCGYSMDAWVVCAKRGVRAALLQLIKKLDVHLPGGRGNGGGSSLRRLANAGWTGAERRPGRRVVRAKRR